MKTKTKTFILSAVLAMSSLGVAAHAAQNQMDITFRIEGIEENFYYGTESIPYDGALSLQDAIIYLDEICDSITVTGAQSAYISDINGDTAATFGGWDGWLVMVNGKNIEVGIDGYELSDGDSVVVYYSDLYGAGMQFPQADLSSVEDGVITFTSIDTTYDDNFNPTQTENPVADMTVFFDKSEYKTDANGKIQISESDLTAGTHTLSVEKYSQDGLPLVLRLEPDFTVDIKGTAITTTTSAASTTPSQSESQTVSTTAEAPSPSTGVKTGLPAVLALAVISVSAVAAIKKNEK